MCPKLFVNADPGKTPVYLRFRSVSFPFSIARYLRFRFRVLTASRAVEAGRSLIFKRGTAGAGTKAAPDQPSARCDAPQESADEVKGRVGEELTAPNPERVRLTPGYTDRWA
jgi:hypothetical protein